MPLTPGCPQAAKYQGLDEQMAAVRVRHAELCLLQAQRGQSLEECHAALTQAPRDPLALATERPSATDPWPVASCFLTPWCDQAADTPGMEEKVGSLCLLTVDYSQQ